MTPVPKRTFEQLQNTSKALKGARRYSKVLKIVNWPRTNCSSAVSSRSMSTACLQLQCSFCKKSSDVSKPRCRLPSGEKSLYAGLCWSSSIHLSLATTSWTAGRKTRGGKAASDSNRTLAPLLPIGTTIKVARDLTIVYLSSRSPLPYPPQSPQMPVVVDTIQPLSTATNVALSSNPSQQDIDSTTSTQFDQAVAKKVAADQTIRAREVSASAAVLGGCMPESHYLNGQDKMVQFAGLYVVRGPTESKHVRYTMDVAVSELQLRGRCIQRFQSFFVLRKRLLEVLKTCRGRLPSHKSTLTGDKDAPQISAGAELVEMLTRPRCIQCPECESTYNQLANVKFPRRTLFPPSLQDVQERSQMLETFLDDCVRIATAWPACQRSKRLFTTALGKFLGVVDLKEYVVNQKEVGSVSKARTTSSGSQVDQDQEKEKTESSSEIMYLPSPHEVSDRIHSSDDVQDRQSEPNFSFISNPSEENEGGGKVRSQSHC